MASGLTVSSLLPFFLLFLLSSTPLPISAAQCNQDDQKALLAIKAAFNNAYHFASWKTSSACCDWYGVDCDSTGRVAGLSIFQDDNLTGTIPPAIADLPYLNNLLLSQLPKLSGPIPSFLAGLKNIQLFRIMNTAVFGPVPAFLSTLTIIDLSHNQLTGAILANLPNLQALHLDHNRLSGAIPASFGSFSRDSQPDLYLSHNSLTGTIPASLSGPNWGIINLSWNQIAGDASFLFGSSKPATQIDLSRNMLSFDLTDVSFPTKLTLLDLSHNKIYGGIPAQINQVAGLVQLGLSYNRLCGEIPAGVVTAKFGQSSYTNNKCLCGAPLAACK
ncbi:Polygalacturonase inhibitor [Cocos nucifera]|uniref:Polygalacturonase inhibitor n=1 Tax=Cocos nucifera TaxID=13894 RepID=A0A8K0HW33_COCNU|nr:Polygalacturonase inhibitor [Cocos nucifera]